MIKLVFMAFLCVASLYGNSFYMTDDITIKNNIAYLKATSKKFDGIANELYESGELASEKKYKYGILVDMKTYKISGALASQVIFKNGKAVNGKIYYENPKKDRVMTNADFMRYKLRY